MGRSALRPPGSRPVAPLPPTGRSTSPSPGNRPSPPEHQRSQRPSLPDISHSGSSSAGSGMKHSTSAPPPPPPFNRGARSNAPPTPNQKTSSSSSSSHSREKPLPPTPNRGPTPTSSAKPNSSSRPPTGGSSAPPPPPYRPHTSAGVSNGPSHVDGSSAPELPQRHNSLHKKHTSGGGTQGRSHAPPPPPSPSPSSQQSARPPPPARDPPGRRAGTGHKPETCKVQLQMFFQITGSGLRKTSSYISKKPQCVQEEICSSYGVTQANMTPKDVQVLRRKLYVPYEDKTKSDISALQQFININVK